MSRCRACNKRLTNAELAVDGHTLGVPDDLCSQCRCIAENPDDAENLEQNQTHIMWDDLEIGDYGDEW